MSNKSWLKLIPDAVTIVLFIMALVGVMTWIIPAGMFETAINEQGREVVLPGTYHQVESEPQGFFSFLQAPFAGMVSAASIIAFVFIVGGAFKVIQATGAINSGLKSIVSLSVAYPKLKGVMLAVLMFFFSLGGATFGMAEEVLVFILITIPLTIRMGYDSVTGVAIPFVGAGAGFAGAFLNPFTIGIAQGIAEVPVFSGFYYRLLIWLVFTSIAIWFVMRYMKKIRLNPSFSPMYDIDRERDLTDFDNGSDRFTINNKLVLGMLGLSLVLLVYGVNKHDWYIPEISALFFGLGLACAAVGRLSVKKASDAFVKGAEEMVMAALVIGLARGILVIAEDGRIIHTMLDFAAGLTEGLPAYLSVQLMFFLQTFLNFFVPSGSGQAALTMPIMAPLSDLMGFSRQTAVLAYQLGDGITNLIVPTSGVLMGILVIAKIPYQIWFQWVWKLLLIFSIVAMLFLIPPVVLFEWV
nr:YfcC family protein [Saprospiraceae bacterium]